MFRFNSIVRVSFRFTHSIWFDSILFDSSVPFPPLIIVIVRILCISFRFTHHRWSRLQYTSRFSVMYRYLILIDISSISNHDIAVSIVWTLFILFSRHYRMAHGLTPNNITKCTIKTQKEGYLTQTITLLLALNNSNIAIC